MIDSYLDRLYEGYLLSDKTISVHLDDFLSGKKKKLLIVGVMGSGKTTLGETLSKKLKVKLYSLDSFWLKIKEQLFKEKEYKDLNEDENNRLFEAFENNIFDILKRNERCIIEGINLASPKFRSLVLKQAIIVLGISSLRAGIRASIRNRSTEDNKGLLTYYLVIKKNMKNVEPLVNKLRKDIINMFGDNVKEYKE